MEPDDEGFLYPQAGEGCTECGLCARVCPIKAERYAVPHTPRYLGVKAKDGSVLANSTSGGVFTLLSDYVLEQQGFIYGAVFDDQMNLIHTEAADSLVRDRMRGAKYIQSDLKDAYQKIKARLDGGQYVLFTGTPCQVHGLRLYLNCEYERLLCVDLLCNGVPSPGVFQSYLRILQKKGKVCDFKFRDKRNGWHHSMVSYTQNGKKLYEAMGKNLYTSLYFQNKISRPVCGVCPYANFKRPGDITIGDFWGIEKLSPLFDDERGVSLCILHNPKAQLTFAAIAGKCEYIECRDQGMLLQPRLLSPPSPSPARARFFKGYVRHGDRYLQGLDKAMRIKSAARRLRRKLQNAVARIKSIFIC